MSRGARIAVNTLTSWSRIATRGAVLILLTPVMVRALGAEEFGLWSLAWSVVGFLGLIDLGFATGVVKWTAQARGSGDLGRRNALLSTALAFYCAGAAASVALMVVGSTFVPGWLHVPEAQCGRAVPLLWILGLRTALVVLPLSLFRGILFGEERIWEIEVIQVAGALVYGLAAWVALDRHTDVVGLAAINTAAVVAEHVAYLVASWRRVPGLRLALHLVDVRLWREAVAFSLYAFLIHALSMALFHLDPILVQLFLPISAVGVYAVAMRVAVNASLFTKQFINAFTPVAAELGERGEPARLGAILVQGTKLALLPAVAISLVLGVFGGDFVRLWVGPDFAAAGPVLVTLGLGVALGVPQLMAANVLTMTGHHRFVALAAALAALQNVVLSLLLVGPLGLLGIALGTVLSALAVDFGLTVPRACRAFGVPYRSYLARGLAPLLPPAAAGLAVCAAVRAVAPPTSLAGVAGAALPGVAVFLAVFWWLVVDRRERGALLARLRPAAPGPAAAGLATGDGVPRAA